MPSDLIDLANDAAERFLQVSLSNVPKPLNKLYSHCLNCTHPLPTPGAYCDSDCRDDHNRALAASVRSGRVE